MNRRESLKTLGLSTLGAGLMLEACKTGPAKPAAVIDQAGLADTAGREAFEIERLKKLYSEQFFTEEEMRTITTLVDIIIPKDEVSGSASEAGVPEFIEFIVKDMPEHQVPLRGGLKWLDMQCLKRYEKPFADCSAQQREEMITAIAYPLKAAPEMQPGVAFFNRMRDLTASGFYTTKMGIDDLGYVGNTPNKWEGPPKEVLAQYGFDGEANS